MKYFNFIDTPEAFLNTPAARAVLLSLSLSLKQKC